MNQEIKLPVNPDHLDSLRWWERRFIYLPVSALTLAGFREWVTSDACPEKGRFSFLGSEIFIDMTGERIDSHAAAKIEITAVLYRFVRANKLGRLFPDGTQLSNVPADLSSGPDLIFATRDTLQSGRLRFIPTADGTDARELEGTPDMVLELVSPSSVTKDNDRLVQQYHRAGIREYWLIDARGAEIDFRMLEYQPGGYVPVPPGRGGWLRSAVFGRRVRLVRGADEVGQVVYTLQVRR